MIDREETLKAIRACLAASEKFDSGQIPLEDTEGVCQATQGYVLRSLAEAAAPIMPNIEEAIGHFRKFRNNS